MRGELFKFGLDWFWESDSFDSLPHTRIGRMVCGFWGGGLGLGWRCLGLFSTVPGDDRTHIRGAGQGWPRGKKIIREYRIWKVVRMLTSLLGARIGGRPGWGTSALTDSLPSFLGLALPPLELYSTTACFVLASLVFCIFIGSTLSIQGSIWQFVRTLPSFCCPPKQWIVNGRGSVDGVPVVVALLVIFSSFTPRQGKNQITYWSSVMRSKSSWYPLLECQYVLGGVGRSMTSTSFNSP